jgi:hypothetical protein
MFRKISLAVVAALALTAAAVAPASAGGGHGHGGHGHGHHGHGHHGHGHHHHFGKSFYVGGSCYRTILTKYGLRTVFVCDRYF